MRASSIASISSTSYDVIVVGARVAGAATAMLLARAGHRVLVVDRGRYGTDTLSTHALMRGAVTQLHRWGILPNVISEGTPPIRQATFIYGDDTLTVPIKARDGVSALYAPRRHVLDRLLVDAASAAGAEIVYGTRLKALQRAPSGRVTGVVVEDESCRMHRISSRFVIGADGLYSATAGLAGALKYRVGKHATATAYGHWPGLDADGYEWYWQHGVSAGVVPTNDGHTCVFVTVPQCGFGTLFSRDQSTAQQSFLETLSKVAPNLVPEIQQAAPVRLHGFAGQIGFFRQSYGPGWALVGDAGYFKDPLTSHGITDALRDAETLADAINDGSDAALASYQAERDEVSADFFETTDAIASFKWDLTSVRPLHEALAKAMSRDIRPLVGVSA